VGVRRRLARVAAGAGAGLSSVALLLLACGARTALPGATALSDAAVDPMPRESSADGLDAPEDIPDVPFDVAPDVPFDVPQDVPFANSCPDAAATLVYAITSDDKLYSFYPPTAAFGFIGNVRCPGAIGGGVFSMAVNRRGIAYVLYVSGDLFEVDTGTAACKKLPYVQGQSGFTFFGMGFAANGDGGVGETLYIEGDPYYPGEVAAGLASVDTTTWTVTPIGSATPPLAGGELTGTGGGDLYVFFYYPTDTSGSRVGHLDKGTGELLSSTFLSAPTIPGNSFAFAYWGGDFYLFTDGTVTEFTPSTGATSVVATMSDMIVGAGVSTCAPE
jgi:hypothetical protein